MMESECSSYSTETRPDFEARKRIESRSGSGVAYRLNLPLNLNLAENAL